MRMEFIKKDILRILKLGELIMEKNYTAEENQIIEDLVKGEISATEVYNKVLDKIDRSPEVKRLMEFKRDHNKAIKFWQKQELVNETVPIKNSKVWGRVAKTFIGASSLLGDRTTYMALKEGEEFGLRQYQEALSSKDISAFQKDQIRNEFIPNQIRHVNTLNAIIKRL